MPEPVVLDKIMVPTDFSELSLHALDYAASIAEAANAEILLFHVFESYPNNTMLKMMVDFPDIMEKGIRDKMEEIKKLGYPNVTSASDEPYGSIANYPSYRRTMSFIPNNPAPNMKIVTVTVFWNSNTHSTVLKTILAE